jgi:hypothetical protein
VHVNLLVFCFQNVIFVVAETKFSDMYVLRTFSLSEKIVTARLVMHRKHNKREQRFTIFITTKNTHIRNDKHLKILKCRATLLIVYSNLFLPQETSSIQGSG